MVRVLWEKVLGDGGFWDRHEAKRTICMPKYCIIADAWRSWNRNGKT